MCYVADTPSSEKILPGSCLLLHLFIFKHTYSSLIISVHLPSREGRGVNVVASSSSNVRYDIIIYYIYTNQR